MSITTAEQLEANEQYDKAYEEYKRVYSQKQNVDILERLGHISMILGKKEEAVEYYSKLLELDASNVMAYEQLMDLYMNTNRYKYYVARGNLHIVQEELSHAVSDFKKALDKTQELEEMNSCRFVLATLYEGLGKSHQAIDEYLRILDSANVSEVVYLKLAQIYVQEDSIGSAIGILERAREHDCDTDNIKENLAELYLRNNQPDKARELSQDSLVKIRSLLDEEKNQEAFELLEGVKVNYKKNAKFHSLFAQYYFNVKDWDNSLAEVIEFDKFEKNSPLTYQMRALIFEEKGNEFDAHINWARYNLAKRDREVALNEYLAAYQIRDYDLLLVKNIAELLEEMNEKNHAMEFWEKLTKLEPKNKKALEKVAEFKGSIGDYRSEAETLEMLYELDDKNASVIKKLAKVYEKLRNKDKALEFYNKFISVSPVNDEYEQIKAKISKLESTEMVEEVGLIDKIMGLFGKK